MIDGALVGGGLGARDLTGSRSGLEKVSHRIKHKFYFTKPFACAFNISLSGICQAQHNA